VILECFNNRQFQNRQLLIIATSSLRHELRRIGLAAVFDSELYVPPITTLASLCHVLHKKGLEDEAIRSFTTETGFGANGGENITIGMRKLLSTIEMMRPGLPRSVVKRLLNDLKM
jgi:vesicle-fusing ATPase